MSPSADAGLTLIELMLVIAILAVAASLALPAYRGYTSETRIQRAILEMRAIELLVRDFADNNGRHPADLTEVGAADMLDPWGHAYRYLNIADFGHSNIGQQRKDRFLVPVNSDFDLYSLGEDGLSTPPFTAAHGRDDVVRANNGSYYGLARDY